MVVLVLGANGFLGRRIVSSLEEAGYRVRKGTRPEIDFERDLEPATWEARLEGVDAVVNAAGIVRATPSASFENVHARGPAALFEACVRRAVPVVHISALGADAHAATEFHRSKRRGDEALLALDVPSLVLQPSLVFGCAGASARLFATLASLPLIPLPGRGEQRVQPVHVDDVALAVVRTIEQRGYVRKRIAAVGPEPVTLRGLLGALHAGLGFGKPRFLQVPKALVELGARLRIGLLDRDTWAMLERGNTGDAAEFRKLLGREPRDVASVMGDCEVRALRMGSRLGWLLPLLRVSIAIVWIVTGVLSMGIYPVEDSLALLARVGLTGTVAYLALHGAAALDVAIGVALLVAKRRRMLWLLQAAVILGYTALITVFLPEQWLHPYGPILKNAPMLAAILLLHQMEER